MRARVFELVRSCQISGDLNARTVTEIIEEGRRRGWPDVVKLGMYLGLMNERWVEHGPATKWVRLMLEAAGSDDVVTRALALAVRAQNFGGDAQAPVDADRDLARAIVLLEGWSGPSSEAVSAHIECARACEQRDVWELQLYHNEAAERCLDPDEGGPDRRAVLLYNRAEVQVNWLAALREMGDCAGLAQRAAFAREALSAADVPSMPESWREDVGRMRELVDAIDPPDGVAPIVTHSAEGDLAGWVHLTRALVSANLAEARAHVARALEELDPDFFMRVYLLAFAVAVELETVQAGHETLGLRWGRELVNSRWGRRTATLASMQSLIDVERLAAEHALLEQHAHVDDLTGLANRRALGRFVESLDARGVTTVAVALVDLDRFKSINDTHGHVIGDTALTRLAEVLTAAVRAQDLVVRLGGDEFLVLLTLNDKAAAWRRCETIVEMVSATDWSEISPGLRVTASAGVAFGALDALDDLRAAADGALYRAKQAGGARVSD